VLGYGALVHDGQADAAFDLAAEIIKAVIGSWVADCGRGGLVIAFLYEDQRGCRGEGLAWDDGGLGIGSRRDGWLGSC
jgi:hypothetical protein